MPFQKKLVGRTLKKDKTILFKEEQKKSIQALLISVSKKADTLAAERTCQILSSNSSEMRPLSRVEETP